MHTHSTLVKAMLIAALAAGALSQADAQPALNFTRIVNNWPTIELYYKVSCDGLQTYSMDKSNFAVYENGLEVRDFTLWCPPPNTHCQFSVALVLDAIRTIGHP